MCSRPAPNLSLLRCLTQQGGDVTQGPLPQTCYQLDVMSVSVKTHILKPNQFLTCYNSRYSLQSQDQSGLQPALQIQLVQQGLACGDTNGFATNWITPKSVCSLSFLWWIKHPRGCKGTLESRPDDKWGDSHAQCPFYAGFRHKQEDRYIYIDMMCCEVKHFIYCT